MIIYTHQNLQISKIQTQPQEVYFSVLYISKLTCLHFVLYPIKFLAVVSYDIYPDTSRLKNQIRSVTLLSCDLETDIIYKYKVSGFQKPTQIINMESFHQLMSHPCIC